MDTPQNHGSLNTFPPELRAFSLQKKTLKKQQHSEGGGAMGTPSRATLIFSVTPRRRCRWPSASVFFFVPATDPLLRRMGPRLAPCVSSTLPGSQWLDFKTPCSAIAKRPNENSRLKNKFSNHIEI